MKKKLTDRDFKALSNFRYLLRKFIVLSEQDAHQEGLDYQQYLLLLHVRHLYKIEPPIVSLLADRLVIKHNSAVELIDRAVENGFLKRRRSTKDKRDVVIQLTAKGKIVIERLAKKRLEELNKSGPALIKALANLIGEIRN